MLSQCTIAEGAYPGMLTRLVSMMQASNCDTLADLYCACRRMGHCCYDQGELLVSVDHDRYAPAVGTAESEQCCSSMFVLFMLAAM